MTSMVKWREALTEREPVTALRAEAQRRLDVVGESGRQGLIDELQALRIDLEIEGWREERLEDINLVCDHLWGWCNPRWTLHPKTQGG